MTTIQSLIDKYSSRSEGLSMVSCDEILRDLIGLVAPMDEVDKILLAKAKERNLYVDFSDKEYAGDKDAPMDRIGLLLYLIN